MNILQIADYISTSLCRGIFGGDAKLLSMKSCFRLMFDLEKKYGSVVRGMIFSKSGKYFVFKTFKILLVFDPFYLYILFSIRKY